MTAAGRQTLAVRAFCDTPATPLNEATLSELIATQEIIASCNIAYALTFP